MRPPVQNLGKAIVDSYSDGYYLMLPDGVINWYTSKKKIQREVKLWSKKHTDPDKIGVTTIEWR